MCNQAWGPSVIESVERMLGASDTEPGESAVLFEAFYRSNYAKSVRLAYALLGWGSPAEDIVQEAFARVWACYSEVANPGGLLRVTLVNLCRDAQRRQIRERRPQPLTPDSPTPSSESAELVELLSRLPYRQRATLVLRYWADFTELEISEALGCRPGTVKTLAQRGLKKLRKVVEP